MPQIREIVDYLISFAPQIYQEHYDNTGLLTGNPSHELKGILTTLDATEDVVDEAVENDCNLIVAHHPIIFKGLKKLTGSNYVERTIIKAIKNEIAIFAAHTNLDNIENGVNKKIAEKLELKNTEILLPKNNLLKKLTFYVPKENTQEVTSSLHNVGAGNVGEYTESSFQSEGTSYFKPGSTTNPSIGSPNQLQHVKENKVEMLVPVDKENTIISTLKEYHPYEEVAYYLTSIDNHNQEIGSGLIGNLSTELNPGDFLLFLKNKMNLSLIRHTKPSQTRIKKIALCGGSGSFLLNEAIKKEADVFITSDFKYHEFFDAEDKIMIADIGHYESEKFTKELFKEIITNKFNSINNIKLSSINTNPINYA